MDFSLKQWRDQQHESEDEQHQPSAKIPRNHQHQHQHQHEQEHVATALPLFVSEPYSSSTIPSSFPTSTPSFSRVGGRNCFSIAQWQELEVQALIYRHMVAGATIPADLLYLVKNSLLSSSPYYLHHYPPHFQPAALMQGGYWGKGGMDPEPGRCRRTDGKKWRCSRDIVAGHKYCERHVHRGRNRSRKPVEFPATATTGSGSESLSKTSATFTGAAVSGAARFSLPGSGASSVDAFQLHTGSEELRSDKKTLFDIQHDSASTHAKSNKVLMHFFDDWPRSLHDSDNPETNANNLSSTSLSISTPTPGNSTSDFLKLSTGNGDDLGNRDGYATSDRDRGQISWTGAWAGNPVVSMGGPLAEALRSSSNSSPTGYHCSTPVA